MSFDILPGDCLEVMRTFPDNHFSGVVTDPPYGLSKDGKRGFMGKEWDAGVPGAEYWKEALKVTKPGGHILAFGGTRTYHRLACAIEDAGWVVKDCISYLYGAGFPKSHNFGRKLGGEWEGYGTALKPAYEPILLAMKPLEGTFLQNVEKWNVAGLNIDEARVGASEPLVRPYAPKLDNNVYGKSLGGGTQKEPKGRWPANLILNEQAAEMLDEQSGFSKSRPDYRSNQKNGGLYQGGFKRAPNFVNDSGGASRFFYTAKASSRERNAGLEASEQKKCGVGALRDAGRGKSSQNTHPTVKPLALMRYLLKLIAPPKDALILDPFAGSGSTIVAAKQLGISAIGIEKHDEYVKIARARVAAHQTEPHD